MSRSEKRRRTGWLPAFCRFEGEVLLHENAHQSNLSAGQFMLAVVPKRLPNYQ